MPKQTSRSWWWVHTCSCVKHQLKNVKLSNNNNPFNFTLISCVFQISTCSLFVYSTPWYLKKNIFSDPFSYLFGRRNLSSRLFVFSWFNYRTLWSCQKHVVSVLRNVGQIIVWYGRSQMYTGFYFSIPKKVDKSLHWCQIKLSLEVESQKEQF